MQPCYRSGWAPKSGWQTRVSAHPTATHRMYENPFSAAPGSVTNRKSAACYQGCIQPERPERNLSGAPRRLSGAASWLQTSRLRTGLSQNNCDTICETMLRHGVFFPTGASHCHARRPRPKCARGPARNYSVELACAAQIARRHAHINSTGGRARTAPRTRRSRTEMPTRSLTALPLRSTFDIVILCLFIFHLSSSGLVVKAFWIVQFSSGCRFWLLNCRTVIRQVSDNAPKMS